MTGTSLIFVGRGILDEWADVSPTFFVQVRLWNDRAWNEENHPSLSGL